MNFFSVLPLKNKIHIFMLPCNILYVNSAGCEIVVYLFTVEYVSFEN